MSYTEKQLKFEWLQSLKVGDVVCDCTYTHLKIVSLEEVWYTDPPGWVRNIIYADWMPLKLCALLISICDFIYKKCKLQKMIDKDLVLENGAHCSAWHCCDPHDHTWNHEDNN